MPFVAKDKNTGERVVITHYDNPKAVLKSGDCVCQLCNEPMIVKAGMIVTPHFAHYSSCTSDYITKPESKEHLALKDIICKWLSARHGEYSTASIDLEVVIPEIRRIADVLVTYPMGWREAHEIQLSPITVEAISERTSDYNRAGIDVFWWCGNKADTPAIRDWNLRNNHGLHISLEVGLVLEKRKIDLSC